MNNIDKNMVLSELSEEEMLNIDGGGWRDVAGSAAGAVIMGGMVVALGFSGPVGLAAGVGWAILSTPSSAS